MNLSFLLLLQLKSQLRMGHNYTKLYEKAFKNFTSGILYIILAFYLTGALLFHLSSLFNYFLLAGMMLNVLPLITIHKVPMFYVKKLLKIYTVAALFPLYGLTVACLLRGVVTPVFWFLTIPVYLYTVFPSRKIIRWSAACLLLMLSSFVLTFILQYTVYENALIDIPPLPIYQMLFTEIVNSLLVLLLICYCLYYIHIFQRLQVDMLIDASEKVVNREKELTLPEDDEAKYVKIYEQIELYMTENQPWLSADFKMTQMVIDLNINASYLTKAIRQQREMNFSTLINHYRIERVKELMQKNEAKYTLEYIYMSSGFQSQASFNRAFKQQMNMTPSEYYREIQA
jgi:AraC-like DNA-binding protein